MVLLGESKSSPFIYVHNAGILKTLKKIVRASSDAGIKIITMYAFSTENWKRSPEEVDGLMNIAVEYFHKEVGELHQNNVKINVIGISTGWAQKSEEGCHEGHRYHCRKHRAGT